MQTHVWKVRVPRHRRDAERDTHTDPGTGTATSQERVLSDHRDRDAHGSSRVTHHDSRVLEVKSRRGVTGGDAEGGPEAGASLVSPETTLLGDRRTAVCCNRLVVKRSKTGATLGSCLLRRFRSRCSPWLSGSVGLSACLCVCVWHRP